MLKGELTIVFDDPFYKAIFERIDGTNYEVAQINLGASLPHMPEILRLVNDYYSQLHFYKSTVEAEKFRHVNPKRAQRLAHKATQKKAIGTKAQQALKRQFEQSKIAKKKASKDRKRERQERRFLQKQAKRREKHRGH
ncbi:YjdF family protein [Lactobacillus taiwanensis]|uniref:YjdF family protein n=1 Tax=Lactobacillus taiwanensis TaxID=508451 RepID=UPI00242C2949|nr:YjdF family protein [Lactobacillus taiwanensis]